MTVSIDLFLPKVLQVAANCPEPTAFDAIRAAAMEFCERTRRWHATLTCAADTNPVQIVAYDATPDANELTLPQDAQVYEVRYVSFDGREMTKKTPADLDEDYNDWRTSTDAGTPRYVTQLALNELQFFPSFDTGDVSAVIVLKPTEDATTLPDFMAAEHREVIAWGALSRLLAMPKQPFSDPNLAVYYGDLFNTKLGSLAIKQAKGQQGAPLRVKPFHF